LLNFDFWPLVKPSREEEGVAPVHLGDLLLFFQRHIEYTYIYIYTL